MNKIIITGLLVLFYITPQVAMAATPNGTTTSAPMMSDTGVYAGISALEMVLSSRRIATEVFVGYNATKNLAYEAGMIMPVSTGQGNYLPALNVSILGRYPINRYVNVTGRLGTTIDNDRSSLYLGLGGSARLTNSLDVRVEARTHGTMPSAAATAGIVYNF